MSLKNEKDYKKLNCGVKKYVDGVLLINDYASWVFLTKDEYEKYLFNDIDTSLFSRLEEKQIILTDNNIGAIKDSINKYLWHLNNGPSLHIIIPTDRCNLTCKYCHAVRSEEDALGRDMTDETIEKTIDFIFTSPSKELVIEFTGGEPLLRFDVIKHGIIYAKKLTSENSVNSSNKNVEFIVVTNGSLLSEEMVDFFKEHNVDICLSLDGPKELHDSNRKFSKVNNINSSYDSVVSAINLLKKKELSFKCLPVVTKQSLQYPEKIADEYMKHGISSIMFKYLSSFGFAQYLKHEIGYSAEEYLEAWRRLIDYLLEINKKGTLIAERLASIALMKIIHGKNSGYTEMSIPCGAAKTQLVYNFDGSIYTCDEARTMDEFKIGNVFSSDLKSIYSHPSVKSMELISLMTTEDNSNPWWTFNGLCPLEIYKKNNGFIENYCSDYRVKIHNGITEFLFDKILHDESSKKILISWADNAW